MDQAMENVREQFPVFKSRTYLNSCSYGALSVGVKQAVEEYLGVRMTTGSDWDHWVTKLEQARGLLAKLFDCSTDDMSVSSSVSESVNSLASALSFRGERNGIVVTDFDFPTTSQIWLAQQSRGARVARARADSSGTAIPLKAFDEVIDERTFIVSIPHVCYRNGVRLDPRPVIELAHERGALVVLDCYQAAGTVPINAPDLEVDFLVGGCLKYLIGTAGVGFMYVRDAERCKLSPFMTGWFAQKNIGAMDIYHHQPSPTARRFESGTPNVCGLYAVSAGLELLLKVGLESISSQVKLLTDGIEERVTQRGWHLVTPAERGAMMAIKSKDAPQLVKLLLKEGIVVSDRDGNVRISPHFYNNTDDLDRLFEVLDANAGLMVSK